MSHKVWMLTEIDIAITVKKLYSPHLRLPFLTDGSCMSEVPWRTPFIESQEGKFFTRYILPIVSVVIALQTNWVVAPFLSFLPPFLTFLAAVMVTAWYGGFPPAVFVTVLSAIVIDFYFIPPLYSFNLKPFDLGTFGFFAVEAMTMAYCIDYLQRTRRPSVISVRAAR